MSDSVSERESIMKSLLQSDAPLLNFKSKLVSSNSNSNSISRSDNLAGHYMIPPVQVKQKVPENKPKMLYYNHFGSTSEQNQEVVALDHNYARPYNWTPESSYFKPAKMLFITPSTTKRKSTNPLASVQNHDDVIDIESVPSEPMELYEKPRAMHLMTECERHAAFARVDQGDDDWEESISKVNWTALQSKIFNGMVTILNNLHMAQLAYVNTRHEPISKRLAIDRAVKRVRRLFCLTAWDPRMTQWLHQLLIDNLSVPYLAAYFDILQTLKSKVPTLVDKIMCGSTSHNRSGVTSNESLLHLLKRPWDPYASHLAQNKPRKLPGNPVLILIPLCPITSNISNYKRQNKWTTLFSNLATTVVVQTNVGSSLNRSTMINIVDQMLASTRAKVQEVKADYPSRPIVLIGLNSGSAIALQVAQIEHVTSVVCLGFSLLTAEGKRGEPDDNLLEIQCPVLFVIGQCSNTAFQEDVEDFRERMRVENNLIVVGSADDYLRVNKRKKFEEGITQNAVDRIILENIGEYLSGLLLSPFPPKIRHSPTNMPIDPTAIMKRVKVERKRQNSNCSSLDSEPPSPTRKLTRPVGRPPGSKSKMKFEPKWSAQIAQGIPSSPSHSPPPSPTLSSNISQQPSSSDTSSDTLTMSKSLPDYELTKTIDNLTDNSTTVKTNNIQKSPRQGTAKMNFMGLNRSVLTSGNTLSNLLQSGSRPNVFSPRSNTGIKVLENLTLNTNASGKLITHPGGRTVDLSKITVLNSINSQRQAGIGGMMVLTESKLKSGATVKGTGSTPILLPISNKSKMSQMSGHPPQRLSTKYVTAKKQLVGRKPPSVSQKPSLITYSSNLAPPTNLTSQDIMDLPIIFADDNQMLTENAKLQQSDIVQVPEIVQPKLTMSNPMGKYVYVNKPIQMTNATSIASKRPALSVPVRTTSEPVKYTKIILSRGSTKKFEAQNTPTSNVLSTIGSLPNEISVRKVEQPTPSAEEIDIENTLLASTIVKPEYMKREDSNSGDNSDRKANIIKIETNKRIRNNELTDDPDYAPSQSFKIAKKENS